MLQERQSLSGFVNPFTCGGRYFYCLDDYCYASCTVYNMLSNDAAYSGYGIDTDMVNTVLHAYVSAAQSGSPRFAPTDTGSAVISKIQAATNFSQDQVYAVMYELYQATQKGDAHCANVLNVASSLTSNPFAQVSSAFEKFFQSLQSVGKYVPYVIVGGGLLYLYSWLPKKKQVSR